MVEIINNFIKRLQFKRGLKARFNHFGREVNYGDQYKIKPVDISKVLKKGCMRDSNVNWKVFTRGKNTNIT